LSTAPSYLYVTSSPDFNANDLNDNVEDHIFFGKKNMTETYTLNNEYAVYAYPKAYGPLSKIRDQNGFTINWGAPEVESLNGEAYYVYRSNLGNL
jgi:hypothetical protein